MAEAEYLCTLQPEATSALARALREGRGECQRAGLGVDGTGLYPPHVSVTGFFRATPRQAAEVARLFAEGLAAGPGGAAIGGDSGRGRGAHAPPAAACGHAGGRHSGGVVVGRVLAVDRGHVLLDIAAPGAAALSRAVASSAAAFGVHLRPKDVGHLSLACGREPSEREFIRRIHDEALQAAAVADCYWELVVAEVVRRSDVEALRQTGQAHVFRDVLRVPLPAPPAGGGAAPPAAPQLSAPGLAARSGYRQAADGLATPVRRRPEAAPALARLAAPADVTPEKRGAEPPGDATPEKRGAEPRGGETSASVALLKRARLEPHAPERLPMADLVAAN